MYYGVGVWERNIESIFVFLACVLLLNRMLQRADKKLHLASACMGSLMGIGILYGAYTHFVNDIFHSISPIRRFLVILGLLFLTVPLSEEIFVLFDRLKEKGICYKQEKNIPLGKFGKFVFSNPLRFTFIVWMFIFACYIPFFLNCWPGNFVYDAPFQLKQAILNAYNTHHPLIHTLLMFWAYDLGRKMGYASMGFQFYSLLQMFLLSGSFAYCCHYLQKRKLPYSLIIGAILFFALFPMNVLYSFTATKDILFSAFFLVMMIFWIRLLHDDETFRWYSYLAMYLVGILCLLFRYNAAYALCAGGLCILLFYKIGRKKKITVLLLIAGIILGANLVNFCLIKATNAETTDRFSETLCLPLQCLARVADYRPDELDKNLYDEIVMYIPEDNIHSYNPYLADMVKTNINEDLLKSNLINFLKLWLKVGLKFPDEYIECIVTNTMGYWYPLGQGAYVVGHFEFYHKLMWVPEEIIKENHCPIVAPYTNLFWSGEYRETPIIGYLFRLDFWTWFLIYYVVWALLRREQNIFFVSTIPFMYLLTCFLGPTAVLRYIYCLVVTIPLLLGMVLDTN